MSTNTSTLADAVRIETVSDEQIKTYNEEGYVLLKGLVDPDEAAVLREEVLAIMDRLGLAPTKLRQTSQYLRGSRLDAFVNSARLRGLAGQLMGGPATMYLPFTAVKTGDGGGRFHHHQDNSYTRFLGPGINLWTALNPMSEANGGLQIAPRSHRAGQLESTNAGDGDAHRKVAWAEDDFLTLAMDPGDCVAFTRLTVHGSGPNRTPGHRVAYAVQYHRDDVEALIDGEQRLLKTHPRYTDIGPKDAIIADGGEKRDGH